MNIIDEGIINELLDSDPDIMSGRKQIGFYNERVLDNIDFERNAFGLEEPSFDSNND